MNLISQPIALTDAVTSFTSGPVPVSDNYGTVVVNMEVAGTVSVDVVPQASDDAENWTNIGDAPIPETTTGVHVFDFGAVADGYVRVVLEQTVTEEGGSVIVYGIDLNLSEQ